MKSGLKSELPFCKMSLSELQKEVITSCVTLVPPVVALGNALDDSKLYVTELQIEHLFKASVTHCRDDGLLFSIHSKLIFPLLSLWFGWC